MLYTGAIAASAASIMLITSAEGLELIQFRVNSSRASLFSNLDWKDMNLGSPPPPTVSINLRATDSADAESATHTPSEH
jgi:hypothetical protein